MIMVIIILIIIIIIIIRAPMLSKSGELCNFLNTPYFESIGALILKA
jgi:hypothetical protein